MNNCKLNIDFSYVLCSEDMCSIWVCSISNLFCSVDFLFKREIVQSYNVQIAFVQSNICSVRSTFCSVVAGQLSGGSCPLFKPRTTSWECPNIVRGHPRDLPRRRALYPSQGSPMDTLNPNPSVRDVILVSPAVHYVSFPPCYLNRT